LRSLSETLFTLNLRVGTITLQRRACGLVSIEGSLKWVRVVVR
jgi:hypothetical protein